MKKKKRNVVMSVGGSSILMIFIVLALVTFAVLSMVTSAADEKLAERNKNSIYARYAVDAEAELTLAKVGAVVASYTADIDLDFASWVKNGLADLPVTAEHTVDGGLSISYTVGEIDGWQARVTLSVDGGYNGDIRGGIRSWQLIFADKSVGDDGGYEFIID